tara:strand:+ start:2267 stop:2443 length:177 start_codon:yes stop_codon:yes gene_type:complete
MFGLEEKTLLKNALIKYVASLQKQFFADKSLDVHTYETQMEYVRSCVEKLHLNELYKL